MPTTRKAKKKPAPGAVIRIPIDESHHTYGRMAPHLFIAVYDRRTTEELTDLEEIVSSPILFIVTAHDTAVRSGRWQTVGKLPLSKAPVQLPECFTQDIGNPERCEIVGPDGSTRPATIAECEGLERVAIWAPEHIEQRLADHYAGRPSAIVEHLRVKRTR